jgi:hypothetical protein
MKKKSSITPKKSSMFEAPAYSICSPVTIELVLKGICPANQNVHGGERLILFQIGLFS